VTTELVNAILSDLSQVSDDVKSVNLELDQLGLSPSREDHVLLASLGIQEEEKGKEELPLESNLSCLLRLRATKNLENLSPKELLQLKVLLSLGENWGLIGVLLIKNSVVDDLIEDALTSCPVLLHKVLVALIRAHDKVHKDANLISQAFVIFLVALLHNFVELRLETGNGLRVASQMSDGDLATNFDQVPHSLNSEGNDVGSEVFRFVNDANQVTTNIHFDNLLGDRLVVADCSQGFKDADHSVSA